MHHIRSALITRCIKELPFTTEITFDYQASHEMNTK